MSSRKHTRSLARKSKPTPQDFDIHNLNAAGIDIGAREIWVSVPPTRDDDPTRPFGTTTDQLHALADWLLACDIDTAVMESTGVYWVPLFEVLEARGIRPHLVNAQHAKGVPGRKSDVLDCQWLRKLHTHGLLRGSFRPTAEITEFRHFMRHRNILIQQSADHARRIQKIMVLMNLQLHTVISDVMGKTGMAILRAIIAGERDPSRLAAHRDGRCRKSADEIANALTGHFKDSQVFALRQEVQQWDLIQLHIQDCDQAAAELLDRINDQLPEVPVAVQSELPLDHQEPAQQDRVRVASVDYGDRLQQLVGVDLVAIPGFGEYSSAALLSEIGTDMSAWPTAGHFASWLRLTPRQDITGGKARSSRTMPGRSRASELLRMAALNAGRTDTAIGAFYRKTAARKGKGTAVVATAHKLARVIYTMIKSQTEYQDLGGKEWEKRQTEQKVRRMRKRAEAMGYIMVKREEEVA